MKSIALYWQTFDELFDEKYFLFLFFKAIFLFSAWNPIWYLCCAEEDFFKYAAYVEICMCQISQF